MKRKFLLLILFITPFLVDAQLTLSGPPVPTTGNTEYYGNYTLVTSAPTPNTPDPSTNMYSRTITFTGPGLWYDTWTIYRYNNYWYSCLRLYPQWYKSLRLLKIH